MGFPKFSDKVLYNVQSLKLKEFPPKLLVLIINAEMKQIGIQSKEPTSRYDKACTREDHPLKAISHSAIFHACKYSETQRYRTRNITNPRYIERVFTSF